MNEQCLLSICPLHYIALTIYNNNGEYLLYALFKFFNFKTCRKRCTEQRYIGLLSGLLKPIIATRMKERSGCCGRAGTINIIVDIKLKFSFSIATLTDASIQSEHASQCGRRAGKNAGNEAALAATPSEYE